MEARWPEHERHENVDGDCVTESICWVNVTRGTKSYCSIWKF